MPSEHYASFIEEAFVKPIRSVLIVDDDYPTFDEMLDSEIAHSERREYPKRKKWYENPTRIKSVIASFRASTRPLLVDIHDGTNVAVGDDVKVAAHLHQSDLLVLDYQLDPDRPGDGSRAIAIIRSLASSNHFNLVIVHTSESLEPVFRDILLGLLSPREEIQLPADADAAAELIEAGEGAAEGFSARLAKSLTVDHYLYSRKHPLFLRTMAKGHQPYSDFAAECESRNWNSDEKKLVLQYLLQRIERGLRSKLNMGPHAGLAWSSGATNWIKTDSVFLAFSNKADEGDLLGELNAALNDWKPQPSQLFLAKLRAEMDEYGVMAEARALGNTHALAHWYHRLLVADGEQRKWLIEENIFRHSDQLMSWILPRVEEFATRLVAKERKSGEAHVLCEQHFRVDLTKREAKLKAEREHNAFVCSKPPRGWHLTAGHVFTMNGDFWVCLSPACDTVPSQLSQARISSFGQRLPFMAVKLYQISDGKSPKDIQSNRFVFLHLEGLVKGFCFNDPSKDASTPIWHTMYAEKRGVFESNFRFHVLNTELGARRLVARKYEARVVGQLRYEYALNLVQRLGTSLTRIGLDFSGPVGD